MHLLVSTKSPHSVLLKECVPLRMLCSGYLSNSRCQWALCFTRCRTGSLLRYLFSRLHRKAQDYRHVIHVPYLSVRAWSLRGARILFHSTLLFAVMTAGDPLDHIPELPCFFWGAGADPLFSRLSVNRGLVCWSVSAILMEVEVVVMTSPCSPPIPAIPLVLDGRERERSWVGIGVWSMYVCVCVCVVVGIKFSSGPRSLDSWRSLQNIYIKPNNRDNKPFYHWARINNAAS